MGDMSPRATAVYRRTYCRQKEDGSYESWDGTIDRVIGHQRWLWERQLRRSLNGDEAAELEALRGIFLSRRGLPSGRTLWLGGTDVSKRREACQFNCSFLRVQTISDVVDAFWLLLQGCGVGFRAVPGNLNGFAHQIADVTTIRSQRTAKGGNSRNVETYADGVWTIVVGDSAEAWAKAVGKLLAGKHPGCRRLVLDLSQIRPGGLRLSGYGWISSGDVDLARALGRIVEILNHRADQLLTHMDIHDIMNLLGTVLSSRRSAEISLHPYGIGDWREFATCKSDLSQTPWRTQSNNSLMFYAKPTRDQLQEVLEIMRDSGGSEPGIINAQHAIVRAAWFSGVNPCAEILLADKGFCNLVEYDLSKLTDKGQIFHEIWLLSRANYRQTCVNLNDGMLQNAWHENNQFLRLCGVSLTGWHKVEVDNDTIEYYRYAAQSGADSMAEDLGTPKSKNITTVKPSGTLSKLMDTTEGMHSPLGAYVFNKVNFGIDDPMLPCLIEAGYEVMDNPYSSSSKLVTFPVFNGGSEYNQDTAVVQLDRYKRLMQNWCDQNVSCTISYSPDELPSILDWLWNNWDHYVGVSFILRTDPTKTAADLGYAYLPQEVVSKQKYDEYVARLKPVNYDDGGSTSDLEADCAGGACPIR